MTTSRRRRLLVIVALGALLLGVGAVATIILTGGPPASRPTTALGPPRFVDVRASAGISHRYTGDFLHVVGGGVAVVDCDDDDRPDLFLAGGTAPAALFRNDSRGGGPIVFDPLDRPELALTGVTGAYPLDIDSDGVADLVVLRVGGTVVLRGLGDCRFERADEAWGIDSDDGWATAFSATWEHGATWPTLAFGHYLVLVDGEPDRSSCADGRLLRPEGSDTPYRGSTPLTPAWCSLSMIFSDWGRTGQRDLRVSNDRHYYSDMSDGQEQLWRIVPGEPPTQYTAEDGWQRVRIEGMGIASQDLTGDGLPEVYLTSQAASRLETLTDGAGRPEYRNIAFPLGVEGAQPSTGGDHRPSTAWHPAFEDVNADGLMDLFVTKGNVSAQPDFAQQDPNELYLGQPDGTFVVVTESAGIVDMESSRGAALVDLDHDGLLDLVVVEREAPVGIWRNVGAGTAMAPVAMGHWLDVDLRQDGPNRDAIGAWVEVRVDGRTTTRERTVGGGHASGQLVPMRFGLGAATSAEVRVQWPDGDWDDWRPVEADGDLLITRTTLVPR